VNVLVTGGAGFIGSHLCEALLARGDHVTALDDLSTGERANVPVGAQLAVADVADAPAVRDLVSGAGFDAVLHVAGQASIATSYADPARDLRTNVAGTLSVLEACIAAGVPRLVHASSMTVYGDPDEIPTTENAPARPVSYYGVTKAAAERYVLLSGERPDVDLSVTALRMFNVYGERQSLTNPYQGVLAIFVGNVLRGEPITIHSDGRQTRDFVHVEDVVEAWLGVLGEDAADGRTLNVGSGRETTIAELARAVVAACGEDPDGWDIRTAPAQRGDQRRSAAAVGALRSLTGWSARIPLADGLRRTVAWARA
jgi:UDP-glucose 4-epimerase